MGCFIKAQVILALWLVLAYDLPPRVSLFGSYHILTPSVIYYWTDARQPGIYLLNSGWPKAELTISSHRNREQIIIVLVEFLLTFFSANHFQFWYCSLLCALEK